MTTEQQHLLKTDNKIQFRILAELYFYGGKTMDMKKTAVIIAITAALSCTAFANDKLCAVNNTGDKNSAVMVPLRETAE